MRVWCFVILLFCISSVVANEDRSLDLVEKGRTMVHNTFKRFMIILPAIFFKLGIAFTLLIVVALAGVTNGFIGFMLLVVGLSSVLARLQDFRRAPVTVPYISPLAAPLHHHQVWDRSDSTTEKNVYGTVSNYPYLPYSGMTGYSPIKYATNA